MTKHTPIQPAGQDPFRRKRGSLIERAEAAFGVEALGPAKVPDVLPERPVRRNDAPSVDEASSASAEPEKEATPVPAKPPSPMVRSQASSASRVTLCGPHAAIDRFSLRRNGLIVPEDPVTGLLEEFRIIKRELLADARQGPDGMARRVLVSSPHEGEGKTFCAANLAIALSAERDIEVLLVDVDVMNPSITRVFGIEEAPGFMDALADHGQRPEELALATDIDRLFIMPAGNCSARDSEYLASARTAQVLDRLTRGAPNRIVIFDTPPALAASPAAELAAHVGQALLVVRADETGRAAIDDARQLLSGCRDLKLLLNAAQFSPSGRRFGDYRRGDLT
ncbi:MAG: P-loop NTPase [Erythrobacter sp.]|uniref:P-loop NTPase n=1 Tax=Erythrobacter sp. TaxID=1042 RepID=UPI002603293E|nr:P-loop NTPase [Erythrobacter sp.]MDJ0977854.1 P-loop NTPase [Erythrobacter sp.]